MRKTYHKNPVGLMVMNMNRPHDHAVYEHVRKAKYAAVSVLDSNHMIKPLGEVGVNYPMSRLYVFEPHPNTTDPEAVKDYAYARYEDVKNLRRDARTKKIYVQVNNEQGFRRDDLLMYYFMMQAASRDPEGPVGLVFRNGATGTPRTGFWGQPNDWEWPEAIQYIEGFHEFDLKLPATDQPAFLDGDHNYTMYYPLLAVNGGRHRKDLPENLYERHNKFLRGELRIDWNLPQDHLGRNFQGMMKALGWKPTNDGRSWQGGRLWAPPQILTEMLFDSLGDTKHLYRDDFIVSPYSAQGLLEKVGRLFFPKRQVYGYEYALQLGISKEALVVPKPVAQYEREARGALTLRNTWMQPDWFGDLKYFEVAWNYIMRWVWAVIYAQTTTIAGTKFAWGWTSDQWRSYQPTETYLRIQERYEPIVSVMLPGEQKPEPETRTFKALVAVNIRSNPGTGNPVIGQLRPGFSYTVYENSRVEEGDYVWWKLQDGGWCAEGTIDGSERYLVDPEAAVSVFTDEDQEDIERAMRALESILHRHTSR